MIRRKWPVRPREKGQAIKPLTIEVIPEFWEKLDRYAAQQSALGRTKERTGKVSKGTIVETLCLRADKQLREV